MALHLTRCTPYTYGVNRCTSYTLSAKGTPVTTDRTLARVAGILYLVTFVTSIPALALKQPFLDAGGVADAAPAQWAALLEIVLALACVGTAVALYPITRRSSPALALGFVASRMMEASLVLVGVLALLALVRVPGGAPVLVALHDGAFLVGPGLLPALNALLLGTVLYRARLVPRAIPLIGLIGAPLLAASALATLFGLVDQVSPLAGLAALPIAVWEFSIGVWLIAKGVRAFAPASVEEKTA